MKVERSLLNRVFNNQITLHRHSEIALCVELLHVHIKTSETESLDNRLEWLSLDKVLRISKQQRGSENLRQTDRQIVGVFFGEEKILLKL